MKGELYRRWLADERGLTISEFVAERRAEVRHMSAQRRFWAIMGPQMQQTPQAVLLQQLSGIQNAPLGLYQGIPTGSLGSLLGGLFR